MKTSLLISLAAFIVLAVVFALKLEKNLELPSNKNDEGGKIVKSVDGSYGEVGDKLKSGSSKSAKAGLTVQESALTQKSSRVYESPTTMPELAKKIFVTSGKERIRAAKTYQKHMQDIFDGTSWLLQGKPDLQEKVKSQVVASVQAIKVLIDGLPDGEQFKSKVQELENLSEKLQLQETELNALNHLHKLSKYYLDISQSKHKEHN